MGTSQRSTGRGGLVDSLGTVEFDADQEVFQATYDCEQDPVGLAVITVVTAAGGTDPVELVPLQSVIDTDALEALLSPATNDGRGCDQVTFRYEGFEITVTSAGMIEATPTTNA